MSDIANDTARMLWEPKAGERVVCIRDHDWVEDDTSVWSFREGETYTVSGVHPDCAFVLTKGRDGDDGLQFGLYDGARFPFNHFFAPITNEEHGSP